MHCCTGSNRPTRPGQRLTLFFLALPPRNRTKARKFLSPVWRFQSCLSFDPLIIGTGKLYLTDDNGWLYSLCDAIRQRYIFRLQWSYISTPLPSAHKAFFLSTNQPIYLHSIPIERPEKKTISNQQNQFKLHPTSKHITTTTTTRAHPIPSQPTKEKAFPHEYTHTHISPRPQAMSHSTPPLASTPSSSGPCKYDTHVPQDSTVYENSTTTSSSSSFYEDDDDDEEDDDDDEDDEEEPFIILQATAIKITSFPPAAGAVAKISMKGKGKGSSIATTTSQKFGGRAPAVASRPPAFLATPGEALPVFSSERAKRAARSVR